MLRFRLLVGGCDFCLLSLLTLRPPPVSGGAFSRSFRRGAPLRYTPRYQAAPAFGASDEMLRFRARLLAKTPAHPLPSPFWAAGFSFAPSVLLAEVKHKNRRATYYKTTGIGTLRAAGGVDT